MSAALLYAAAFCGSATPGLLLVWLGWRAFRREERRHAASRNLMREVMQDIARDTTPKARRDVPVS